MTPELRIFLCLIGLALVCAAPVVRCYLRWPLPRLTKSRPPTRAESGVPFAFVRHATYIEQPRAFAKHGAAKKRGRR